MHGTYVGSLELNKARMQREAEERIKLNVLLAEEDALNKQRRNTEKARLREV